MFFISANAEINPQYRFPKLINGGTCRSISEAIALAINLQASMYRHNFENGKKRGSQFNSWWEERIRPSECFSEILNTLLLKWQPYVDHVKQNMTSKNHIGKKD